MSTYMITEKSRNAKTGPIMTVTSQSSTCPDACPLKTKGCYAKYGPLGMQWRKHDATGTKGLDKLIDAIKTQAGKLWRFNVAGDLPGEGDAIDCSDLYDIALANQEAGARGFTYTHKPVLETLYDGPHWLATGERKVVRNGTNHATAMANRSAIEAANRRGFTINLSANDLTNADELADLGIAPVVTLLPADQLTNTTTPGGRKVVVCPAVIRDDVSCATCGLCQRQREAIVGFPAHGAAAKTVSGIASTATI